MHSNNIAINYFMAGTNVLGLIPLIYCEDLFHKFIIAVVIIVSTLMHLSETKHGLKGILHQHSNLFLNLDRGVAYVASLYCAYKWFNANFLFVIQEGNCIPRVIMVPKEKYLAVHQEEFDTMKKHCKRVNNRNILVNNITWNGNYGEQDITPYSKILTKMQVYADGDDDLVHKQDVDWYESSIFPRTQTFSIYDSFEQLMVKYAGKIVDHIVSIEADNGVERGF
jgi:hypothetical protein